MCGPSATTAISPISSHMQDELTEALDDRRHLRLLAHRQTIF